MVAGSVVEGVVVQTPDSTEVNSVAVVVGGCSPPGLPGWFSGVFATRRGDGIGGGVWVAWRRCCWQLAAGLALESVVVQTPDSTEVNSVAVVDGGCSPPGLSRWFSGVFATRRGDVIGGGVWIALAEVLLAVGCWFGLGGRGSADA